MGVDKSFKGVHSKITSNVKRLASSGVWSHDRDAPEQVSSHFSDSSNDHLSTNAETKWRKTS